MLPSVIANNSSWRSCSHHPHCWTNFTSSTRKRKNAGIFTIWSVISSRQHFQKLSGSLTALNPKSEQRYSSLWTCFYCIVRTQLETSSSSTSSRTSQRRSILTWQPLIRQRTTVTWSSCAQSSSFSGTSLSIRLTSRCCLSHRSLLHWSRCTIAHSTGSVQGTSWTSWRDSSRLGGTAMKL